MYKKDYSEEPLKSYYCSYARTLKPEYIGEHENGWSVKGEIIEDYFEWVNDFEATKGDKYVKGNFEGVVEASDEQTLNEFLELFPFCEWDYWDI